MTDTRTELVRAEEERFAQIHGLLEHLTPEQMREPGYTEDWSVRDVVAHLACWCAEAARHLEQLRLGTYDLTREDEKAISRDVDAINQRFHDACRDLSLDDVKVEWASSRFRMLQEWDDLPEVSGRAAGWFRSSGPEHYDEHLPRLREWVAELTGARTGGS
ncbi:MAG: ClbS/DfsB family four-helix bundle protein [Actinomycetota bacterium]